MSDILDYGRDREPRWRRWRLAGAVIGVAAAIAAFVWYLPGVRQHSAQPRPSAASPSRTAREGPGSLAAAPSALSTEPALMTGQSLPRDAGLWLMLGGQNPAWLSVPAGQTEPIHGLPTPGKSYELIRIAGGWAARPFPANQAGCDYCALGPLPVYYVADGSRTASRIGIANLVAPAATRGALWLISYPRGSARGATDDAQEISVTGAALGPRLRLPAGYVIDQGTRAGLLLVQELASPGYVGYELWDPRTRRVIRSLVNVIAASPAEIAWVSGCAAGCRVHVLDLHGGRVHGISLPAQSQTYEGAFSPDGRLLAMLATGTTSAGRAATSLLMVATVASGRITAVPGSTVGSGISVAFGWQPGSHQLVAYVGVSASDRPEWQIAAWRPGDARLSVALARAPGASWPVLDQGSY